MERIGLVFAGGGGKGAYEIGVWKYLKEVKLDTKVVAISGTSVGALNATMFACNGYEKAVGMWASLTKNTIMKPREITLDTVLHWILTVNSAFEAFSNPYGLVDNGKVFNFFYKLTSGVKSEYLFSPEGIKTVIKKGLRDYNFSNSKIPICYVTCFNIDALKPESIKLNECTQSDIPKYLLASCSIPFVFPSVNIHGVEYWDGGTPIFGDNVPIRPLYDNRNEFGIDTIIVVHLKKDEKTYKGEFKGVKIIDISPSFDIGNFINGTLSFNKGDVDSLIFLGYKNAKKKLKDYL